MCPTGQWLLLVSYNRTSSTARHLHDGCSRPDTSFRCGHLVLHPAWLLPLLPVGRELRIAPYSGWCRAAPCGRLVQQKRLTSTFQSWGSAIRVWRCSPPSETLGFELSQLLSRGSPFSPPCSGVSTATSDLHPPGSPRPRPTSCNHNARSEVSPAIPLHS